jgi:hypothetical protein
MNRRSALRTLALTGALGLSLLPSACSDDDPTVAGDTTTEAPPTTNGSATETVIDPGDGGEYQPEIDPDSFTDVIDNPFLPLAVGSTWVYEGAVDGEPERIEVTVTDETKVVMGIDAVVVRDSVYAGDELVEDTYDWFAQDADGNVWYLGEDSNEYENGELVSKDGSWEAGVDGAEPGIVMLADPQVGQAYRQEFYPGEAEDLGEVVRSGAAETVTAGSYTGLVVIQEWNPLEPEVIEEKYYAAGVGKVLGIHTAGPGERVELVEFTAGA